MAHIAGCLVALTLLVTPAAAGAQNPPPIPLSPARDMSVSFSAGGGWKIGFGDYGLNSYPAFDWVANVRFGLTTHLALEAEVGRWTKSEVSEYGSPDNWLDRYEFSQADWHAGINIVGRVPGRVVSFFGGGGPGVWSVAEEFTSRVSGPSVGPQGRSDHWEYQDTKYGVQGVVGLDVNITKRLQVFGVGRMEVVSRESYPMLFAVHAGVRVVF